MSGQGHPTTSTTLPPLDVQQARQDFPVLHQQVNGKPLVYLDNAATTQKPREVIEALDRYYSRDNANVHRGVHTLSQRATDAFESARSEVRRFLNAKEDREIVFVRGATEAINLVAATFGRHQVQQGDEVLVSWMEHHSNIVPWQILCDEKGASLKVVPINDRGELEMDDYERLLSPRTKLVAMTHVSNALGTINPVKQIIQMAHQRGIPALIDGAQAVAHLRVDVQDLDADFYVLSGHKLYGPTGIGVLYGKAKHLDKMPPYQGGGDMIRSVTFEKTLYNVPPYKFEAGTPDIAGAIGLAAAIKYVGRLGLDRISAHEAELLAYAHQALSGIEGVRIIGTAREKASVVSFVVEQIHAHDLGTILDQEGVAIRAGHHCAQPTMARFGVAATARASFALYNTKDEVDALVRALDKGFEVFK